MDNEFFIAFPDLYDDITPMEAIPRSIGYLLPQRTIEERGTTVASIGTRQQVSEDSRGYVTLASSLAPMVLDPWNQALFELTGENVAAWP